MPILFASLVDHPERGRFVELRRNIADPVALQEAQEILIRCGAISYCADRLIRKYRSAKRILNRIPLSDPEPVASLLEEIIAPVHELLAAAEDG